MTPKIAVVVIVAILCLNGCTDRATVIEQQIVEFGTIIRITLVSENVELAERQLTEIENRLKQHRHFWHAWEDSDLSRFNQQLLDAKPHKIPPSLATLIKRSKQYYRDTQGLFNPALGNLIAAYGFHAESELQVLIIDSIQKDLPTMDDLVINNGKAQSNNPHLALDLGAIAKGYSIDEIAKWLTRQNLDHFLIDAGGDLVSSGNRGGKPWSVGLQNPFAPGVIAAIELDQPMALFTSGNYQRNYRRGGKLVHHIIDPRNGRPSAHIASATVLHQDPVLADVAATTLMIDGVQNHRQIARSLGIKHYLIIAQDKKIIVSESFNNQLDWFSDWPKEIIASDP